MWKYTNDTKKLSSGDSNLIGEIPAYPVKLILTKNVELIFAANSPVNEDIRNQLVLGNKLFYGNLILKNIPQNIDVKKINSYRIQDFSTQELNVLTNVGSTDNVGQIKPQNISKFQLLNKKNNFELKNNFRRNSIDTKLLQKKELPKTNNAMMINTNFALSHKTFVRSFNPTLINEVHKPKLEPQRTIEVSIIPTPQIATNNFNFSGEIKDKSNIPIENAEVILMNVTNAISVSILTISNGVFLFNNLIGSKYLLKIKKSGFKIYEEKVDLINNIAKTIIIEKESLPLETFQVLGVICKKLPLLPNPDPNYVYM